MNEVKIFDYHETEVRTIIGKDGEPWFVAKDVCDILSLGNVSMTVQKLKANQKGVNQIDTLGGMQEMIFINESGLYKILMRSDKPEAEKFQDWIAEEVVPSIRKTGSYSIKPKTYGEALIEAGRLAIENEQLLLSQEKMLITQEKNKPYVAFAEEVADTTGAIHIGDFAKVLKDQNIQMGRNRLFEWLRENGYLISKSNMPYQKYKENGYFIVKEGVRNSIFGTKPCFTTLITGRGQIAIFSKLKELYTT